MRQYAKFVDLPVKTLFDFNGNKCQKTSSRTAQFLGYNRRFYFSGRDIVVVGRHTLLDANYFDAV